MMSVCEADSSHAGHYLTEQVSDAALSISPSNARHPFPEHGRIDQGVAPEQEANSRAALKQVPHDLMPDKHNVGTNHRAKAVVHALHEKALQVWNIAGNVEGHYLPLPLRNVLVAAENAALHERRAVRLVPLVNNGFAGRQLAAGAAQVPQLLFVFFRQGPDAL
jgi:hypothetical protein